MSLTKLHLQHDAAVMRWSLEYGIVSGSDVIKWADRWITELEHPPIEVIDLSMSRREFEANVIATLVELSGDLSLTEVWSPVMASLLEKAEANSAEDSQVARILFSMAQNGHAPQEAENEMFRFWDAIDLAKEGVTDCYDEEREQLIRFLARWATEVPAQQSVAADTPQAARR